MASVTSLFITGAQVWLVVENISHWPVPVTLLLMLKYWVFGDDAAFAVVVHVSLYVAVVVIGIGIKNGGPTVHSPGAPISVCRSVRVIFAVLQFCDWAMMGQKQAAKKTSRNFVMAASSIECGEAGRMPLALSFPHNR